MKNSHENKLIQKSHGVTPKIQQFMTIKITQIMHARKRRRVIIMLMERVIGISRFRTLLACACFQLETQEKLLGADKSSCDVKIFILILKSITKLIINACWLSEIDLIELLKEDSFRGKLHGCWLLGKIHQVLFLATSQSIENQKLK